MIVRPLRPSNEVLDLVFMQRLMDELEAENRRFRGKLSSLRFSLLVTDEIVKVRVLTRRPLNLLLQQLQLYHDWSKTSPAS